MIYALDANTISFFLRGEGNVAGNFQERIVEDVGCLISRLKDLGLSPCNLMPCLRT